MVVTRDLILRLQAVIKSCYKKDYEEKRRKISENFLTFDEIPIPRYLLQLELTLDPGSFMGDLCILAIYNFLFQSKYLWSSQFRLDASVRSS